jgi:transcriptional regulator NrdR family protein
MNCPLCKSDQNFVTHTRAEETIIRRGRQCRECGKRWLTIEAAVEVYKRSEAALKLARQLHDLAEMEGPPDFPV